MAIHPTAIISKKAYISANASVGAYSVIGDNVEIGEGTIVDAHVHIIKNTKIGKNNYFASGSVIAGNPQDHNYKGQETFIEIGDNNQFREFTTVHIATSTDTPTRIGNNCMFMIGTHIAHDCKIDDNVNIANYTSFAGFVHLEEGVFFSANSGAHQFCRIGKYAMIGAMAKITQDIPPFCMVADNPAKLIGINSVGLKRAGMTIHDLKDIKDAFKRLFSEKSNLKDEKAALAKHPNPHVQYLVNFFDNSKRGILMKRAGEIN